MTLIIKSFEKLFQPNYKSLDGKLDTLKEIIEDRHAISEIIKKAKNPMIILGQSALTQKYGKFIFESFKNYLHNNKKILKDWNPLNIISENASTIGSLDLGIYQTINGLNNTLKNLQDHNYELVFLLGNDNLNFKKKNEFIVYQGSHGDKGAEMADVILPGAAYTEQNGYYTNLEGKLQKAFKASYPPGEAKEDWLIINELAKNINNKTLFKDVEVTLSGSNAGVFLFEEITFQGGGGFSLKISFFLFCFWPGRFNGI